VMAAGGPAAKTRSICAGICSCRPAPSVTVRISAASAIAEKDQQRKDDDDGADSKEHALL
jgi:hypothetical protein